MSVLKIRLAVIGGGLAGCILMNGLTKHSQLDAHIYEANSELKERGASVGLQPHAQRALRLLGLEDLLEKARAVDAGCFRMVVGEGKDAGKTVFDLPNEAKTMRRAALLKELLTPIPRERIHLNKRLSHIEATTLHFSDGTSAEADLIIGADGIHGCVRKYVLDEGHPAIEPKHAGFWDGREIVGLAEAASLLGTDNIDKNNPRQQMYFGNGQMFYQDTIDDAQRICIVPGGIIPPDWNKAQWKYTVSRDWLFEQFSGFGDFGRDMLDLFCNGRDEISVFAQWESATAPRLFNEKKTICMMGDAAHATTPWQAAGLAQAIEDSLMLTSVLGECRDAQDVPAALEAYDQFMRPHGDHIVQSSREVGMIMCGSAGLDVKELQDALHHRWDEMFGWDTEAAVKQAIEISVKLRNRPS